MKSKKKMYKCKKDWELNGIIYYQKGKNYSGVYVAGDKFNTINVAGDKFNTINVAGEYGFGAGNFHTGSEYFDVD